MLFHGLLKKGACNLVNKKKIAVVTLYGNFNYGNKLQNYAVQEILSKRNFEIYTLKLDEDKGIYKKIRYKARKLKNTVLAFAMKERRNDIKRKVVFKKFNKNYLNYYKKTVDVFHTETLNEQFDYFVAGSDQVWNPNYSSNPYFFLLGFASNNKIVSIAPSFGVQNIEEHQGIVYKPLLSRFKYLSVREEEGKTIIRNLLNREAEVLIDPTLMLSGSEWIRISKKVVNVPEKYILTYFLGDSKHLNEEIIEKYSNKYNLPIIDIANPENPRMYINGPSEFIYLIKNATLICTNSFHGCVFSFIFDRPMVIFDREETIYGNMNSRIQTLQNKFLLSYRHVDKIDETLLLFSDYSCGKEILVEEQKKFNDYLDKNFI